MYRRWGTRQSILIDGQKLKDEIWCWKKIFASLVIVSLKFIFPSISPTYNCSFNFVDL